ncbi:MAG: flagellar hook-length control protein FliK, partial [Azoarcus sp.]|nr:flagellar hook-length control protein FliK [Azoarcus sp.]
VAETDALPLEKDSAREPTLAATAKLARAPILAAHATASPNTPAVAQSVTEAIVLTQRADAGNIQGARADGMARATGVDTGSNPGSNPLFSLRAPSQTASGTPQLPVQTPAGQRGWAEEIGNRVTWMLGRAQSKAELVLTPPNLGKVEVSINLNGDQTTAQFVASSQAARDALEQSMPRLRELLAQAGINLGQANVDTGEARREHETSSGHSSSNGGRGGQDSASDDELGQEDTHATRWIRQDNGLVNTFA